MVFDLTPQVPAVFDFMHLILAVLSILLVFILILKPSQKSEQSSVTDEKVEEKPAPASPRPQSQLREMNSDGALQLLSLLQLQGRFVDFVREDIAQYSDEEVGAAARVVHKGLRASFDDHFTVVAIRDEEEGDAVTLEPGFNAQEIQLLGQVSGEAPFKGTLVHQGWKVTDVRLPKIVEGRDNKVLAAAQVEL